MLKARIAVNRHTDVEHEVIELESLARKNALDEATLAALIAEARPLLVDFRQTAVAAADGHFSAAIDKTLKGDKYEVKFSLQEEPESRRGGLMSFFRR